MSNPRASKTDMEKLHSILCKQLTAILEKGEMSDPKTGETVPIPASYFQAAIAFLGANDIKGVPVEGSPLANLMKGLDLSALKKDIEARASH